VHACAQRGWSIEETAAELPKVSEKAQERARSGDDGMPLSPQKMPPQTPCAVGGRAGVDIQFHPIMAISPSGFGLEAQIRLLSGVIG